MPDPNESIRILVCDDHPVVRSGLRGMIASQSDLEVVGEATNGAQAITLTRRLRPDVVLMDLRMPEVDGVTAISQIKTERLDTKVLILTTYQADADVLRAIQRGATGFLLKDAPEEELFSAIRSVAEGKSPLAPSVAGRLIERLRGEVDTLSAREVEILQLAARGTNNRGIAAKLFISEATVKSHLSRIFDKLSTSDRTEAVVVAINRGIISPDT